MVLRLLITEWERALERFQPQKLKQKKANVKQYAVPLHKGRNYPRFHMHVIKRGRLWVEIWVHLDWKRHKKWEVFNGELIDFVNKLRKV